MSYQNIVREYIKTKEELEDVLLNTDNSKLNNTQLMWKHKIIAGRYKNSRKNFTDKVTPQESKWLDEMKDIESKVDKVKLSEFKVNPKINATDPQLIKYASDFLKLTPEEQKKIFIDSGYFKDTYEIPGTGLVLKRAGGMAGTSGNIIEDYLANKVMEDSFLKGTKEGSAKSIDPNWKTSILERPKLIAIPEEEPLLIQKKLINPSEIFKTKFEDDIEKMKKDYLNTLSTNLEEDYIPNDIGIYNSKVETPANLGIDPETHQVKAFDAMISKAPFEDFHKKLKKFKEALYRASNAKVFRSLAPIAKVGGKVGLPLAAAYSNYSEAKEMGLPKPIAAGYALGEEFNPLPFSGIDYYKGIEKAAEGRAKNISKYYEEEAKKPYMNSPAARDKAYGTLRKLLNGYMLDENVPKRDIKKSWFNPETEDYEYEYE